MKRGASFEPTREGGGCMVQWRMGSGGRRGGDAPWGSFALPSIAWARSDRIRDAGTVDVRFVGSLSCSFRGILHPCPDLTSLSVLFLMDAEYTCMMASKGSVW